MFAGKKSAQIREILISESAWEEMTCLFAPSLTVVTGKGINAAKESIIITYKDSPEFIRITNNDVVNSVSNFDEVSKIKSGFSNVKVSRFTSINLDKEVYIISRNGMLGGSQYFTKNLIAYPNENLIIKATGVTHVKK